MATRKDQPNESGELFDVCCSHCSADNRVSEAKKFCVECGLHFCEQCVRFHKTIPSLQLHEIVDLTQGDKGEDRQNKIQLPTERCSVHHGKLMDMFCKDHDIVCCGVCIAIKHRSCVNIDYIPDIAKDVQTSQEYTDVKDSVAAVLSDMKLEKQKRTSNIEKLSEEKVKLLTSVEEYQQKLIEKIKVIAEATKLEVLSEFEDMKKAIAADVDTLDIFIPAMETSLQKLSVSNSAQLFVNIKTTKRAVKDEETVLKEISSNWKDKQLSYILNESLERTISGMTTFVAFEDRDVQEYEAKLYGRYKINEMSFSHNITGICPLHDGSFIMIDYNNQKVIRLNSYYEVKHSVSVKDNPIGICNINKKEVAVSLYNTGKIQFVSVNDDLHLLSTIQVDTYCNGIHYNESSDELFVCCGECINVYNRAGHLQRVLKTDPNGEPLFSSPRLVIVNYRNNEIIVTDYYKGLIAVDLQGKRKWSLKDEKLVSPWGLCALPSGIIFVSGNSSNNVLQVDKNGNKIGVLMDSTKKLKESYSLAFDSLNSRLMVGMNSENIHVYTLLPKT